MSERVWVVDETFAVIGMCILTLVYVSYIIFYMVSEKKYWDEYDKKIEEIEEIEEEEKRRQ